MADTGKHSIKKSKEKGGRAAAFLKDFFSGPKKKVILKSILVLIGIGILSTVIMTTVLAVRIGRINMESLYSNIERPSILYDINGEQIDTLHYTQDRTIVPADEMPDDLKNSFIAIEDKTFYKHHGFNFKRMFGAVLSKLIGRSSSISGTSTITQQLARNVYLPEIKSQRSIHRKLSEMFIAWRIEHSLTKDQILEAYLNTIYLGYGNYGVGAASRTYFSKDVKDLSLAECAALAALPQAPDAYALITNEADEYSEPISNINYYSLDQIKDSDTDAENDDSAEASDEEEARRMVYTGGLEIHTTLNSEIQNAIYNEFQNDSNFPVAVDGSKVQASMVVTEVGTGHISGMVGGRDAGGSQLFNRAVSPRQPGSSIKPLRVNGEEWPRNFSKSYSGRQTLRTALQQSINTCAVKMLWSRIMRQVSGITSGQYREMPSNVVQKNGEYYTSGTEKNTSTYKGGGKGSGGGSSGGDTQNP